MKYLKTFESYIDTDLISQVEFYKVPTGEKTVFKPSFGAKKGETNFYQLRLDGKPVVEIEVNPNSKYGKPEIMQTKGEVISLKFYVAHIRYKFPVIVQMKNGKVLDFFAKLPSYFLHDVFLHILLSIL